MESLVYYPTFEPPNEEWLKYALLYLPRFSPIIPHAKRQDLSEPFKRIMEKTDLIDPFAPEYIHGAAASEDAIKMVETILMRPHPISEIFGEINLIRKWRNSKNWTFDICREKFSDTWLDFCLENSFGQRSHDGVLIAEEIAFIFMSYLANAIAYEKSASIITDDAKFDGFTTYSQLGSPSSERTISFAKATIKQLLPQNLSSIPLEKIINFRREHFDLILAFNNQLQKMGAEIVNGLTVGQFVDEMQQTNNELVIAYAKAGLKLIIAPLVAYLALPTAAGITAATVIGGLSALDYATDGLYMIKNGDDHRTSRRHTQKYLTAIGTLT